MDTLLINFLLIPLMVTQSLAESTQMREPSEDKQFFASTYLSITSLATDQPGSNTTTQQSNKFIRTRKLPTRLKNSKRATRNNSPEQESVLGANGGDRFIVGSHYQYLFSKDADQLLALYCVFQI